VILSLKGVFLYQNSTGINSTLAAAQVSDITYIKTKQGWLFLTIVIDLGDRKVIGWALSATMKSIH